MFYFNDEKIELHYLNDIYNEESIQVNISLSLEFYISELLKMNPDRVIAIKKNNKLIKIKRNILLSILFDAINICPSFAFDENIKNYSIDDLKKYSKYTKYKYIKNSNPDNLIQPTINDLIQLDLLYNKNVDEFNIFINSKLQKYIKYSALDYILDNNLFFTKSLEHFLLNFNFKQSTNSQFALNYYNLTKIYFNYYNLRKFIEELVKNNDKYVLFILNKYLYLAPEYIYIGLDNALTTLKSYNQKIVFVNILCKNGKFYQYNISLLNKMEFKDKVSFEILKNTINNIYYLYTDNLIINFNNKEFKTGTFYDFKSYILKYINESLNETYEFELNLTDSYVYISKNFVNNIKYYIYKYNFDTSKKYLINPNFIKDKTTILSKNTDLKTKLIERYHISNEQASLIIEIKEFGIDDITIFNNFSFYNFKMIEIYKNPLLIILSYKMNLKNISKKILEYLNINITIDMINKIDNIKENKLIDIEDVLKNI